MSVSPLSTATSSQTDQLEELRITGLAKGYLGVQALKGVDLSVRRGSIHALAGQNGAGKSTLVKILSGAEAPDRGTITLGGRLIELGLLVCVVLTVPLFSMELPKELPRMRFFAGLDFAWVAVLFSITVLDYATR